jgi:hypothetical protein
MGILPIKALLLWYWETWAIHLFVTTVTNRATFARIVTNSRTILLEVGYKVVVLVDLLEEVVEETCLMPFKEAMT